MERKANTKFMPSEEELEKQRKEILVEINEVNNEIRSDRKKKVFIGILLIIAIIILIKLIFGTIEINNIFGYPKNKARFYKLTMNDKTISVGYELTHKLPIVPFIVNLNSDYMGGNHIQDDEDGVYFYPDDSEQYIIEIKSYSCYKGDYQVECVYDNQNMKENYDTEYTNLKIVRTSNPYEEIYNGRFVNDITKFVEEKGVYYVGITAKYSNVETDVYFYFKR